MGDAGQKFKDLTADFSKSTNITVQVESIPWDNVNDKLTTAVASGNGPDVTQVGLSQLPSFISADALLDLSAQVKDHPALADSNFLPAVSAANLNPSGKVLSVPWVSDVRVLFYRSDILTEAGIAGPPTTWQELRDSAAKLAARGKGKYGFYIPQWDSALPVALTWQAGGDVVGSDGKVSFDTPAFKKAAGFYTGMYKDKLVPTASDFDQAQGFISGTTPMLISGPYLAGAVKEQAPELDGKWSVAPLPKDEAGTALFAGSNMAVWKTSKNVDGSLALLDFLAQPETQVSWFKATNELPTTMSGLSDSALTSDPNVAVYSKQLQDAKLLPLVPAWDKISTAMLDSLNSIVLKGQDEAATLTTLNETVAKLQ